MDMQEIERAIAGAHQPIANAIKEMKGLHAKDLEKRDEQLLELRARLLEIEQKGVRFPGNPGLDLQSPGAAMAKAIAESEDLPNFMKGSRKDFAVSVPMSTKTAIVSGSALVQSQRDMMRAPAEQILTVRDLLPSVPTESGSIEYPVENVFTNNAGPQFSSPNDRENVVKNESGITFTLGTAPVITVAHWIPVAKQVLGDAKGLQKYIETRLLYGLKLNEEAQLLLGDGTGGNMTGLMTGAVNYNRSVSSDNKLDTLRKAVTQLQLANYRCTGMVLNPADWEGIELLKDTTGQYLAITVKENGREVAWKVPVIPSNSMTQGQFLAGDFERGALIRDREEANVFVSTQHSDFFIRNMVAILCEARLALEIFSAAAFVKGNLPA